MFRKQRPVRLHNQFARRLRGGVWAVPTQLVVLIKGPSRWRKSIDLVRRDDDRGDRSSCGSQGLEHVDRAHHVCRPSATWVLIANGNQRLGSEVKHEVDIVRQHEGLGEVKLTPSVSAPLGWLTDIPPHSDEALPGNQFHQPATLEPGRPRHQSQTTGSFQSRRLTPVAHEALSLTFAGIKYRHQSDSAARLRVDRIGVDGMPIRVA